MGSPVTELPDTTLFVKFFFRNFQADISSLRESIKDLQAAISTLREFITVGEAGFSALQGERVNLYFGASNFSSTYKLEYSTQPY